MYLFYLINQQSSKHFYTCFTNVLQTTKNELRKLTTITMLYMFTTLGGQINLNDNIKKELTSNRKLSI